ncbi:SDR family NAD(P)-dependent oxidoreductase [Simkania sp.]|uniref:SDR family NAD(P)-dependent oxidoreductase n=1 Tax=Simkania sp. TaxID=34094 RepID=UPI003B5193EA
MKRALITGATSDLGQALATALAKQGYTLFLTAPDPKKLETLKPLGSCLAADLTSASERQNVIEWMKDYPPTLLINNAGTGLYGPALESETSEQLALLKLNAEAALELCIEGARCMERPGTILNISSAAAWMPYPCFSVYSASKRFLLDFSQAFDAEVCHMGIRVLCACPGQIATSFRVKASKGRFQEKTPLTLSIEKVVRSLLKQIERRQGVKVIDWRYRILLILLKCLPSRLQKSILYRTLSKRALSN